MRATNVLVFPVPGPAITAIRGATARTALSCSLSSAGAAPAMAFVRSILVAAALVAAAPFALAAFRAMSDAMSGAISGLSTAAAACIKPLSCAGSHIPSALAAVPSGTAPSTPSPVCCSPATFAPPSGPAAPIPPIGKRLICPSSSSSSEGVKRQIVPYSPSNPGKRRTFPSLSRRIPSPIR